MNKIEKGKGLFDKIANLIEQARRRVATTINQEMVVLYWDIGKTIKEEIIKSDRAEYRKQIVHSVSGELVRRYGKGFSEKNLWHIVKFYETYPILSALRREFQGLSWTHIKTIIYLNDELKRKFYATLCQKEHWSREHIELLFLPEDRIKVSAYLTKLPSKELFAEKLHKAVQIAQLKLESKDD
jgi:hypothetical protein